MCFNKSSQTKLIKSRLFSTPAMILFVEVGRASEVNFYHHHIIISLIIIIIAIIIIISIINILSTLPTCRDSENLMFSINIITYITIILITIIIVHYHQHCYCDSFFINIIVFILQFRLHAD